jgi:hypothetical protein
MTAGLGNWIWYDVNENGIQEAGEVGIEGAEVTLTVTWPDGTATALKTVSDENGRYSFGNLLLDEDYDGAGEDEPSFVLSATPPPGFPYPTEFDEGADDELDADNYHGVAASLVMGTVDESYDFGWMTHPLAVTIASISAEMTPEGVVISWQTVSEQNNAGFNLYRADSPDGPWRRLNRDLIASLAPGALESRTYRWVDAPIRPDRTLYFQLEDVALGGAVTRHDPVQVAGAGPAAVRLSRYRATSEAPALAAIVGLVVLIGLVAGGYQRIRG